MDPTLVDKIIAGDSASEISDYIKDTLFAKSSAKIDNVRPEVAARLFGGNEEDSTENVETTNYEEETPEEEWCQEH